MSPQKILLVEDDDYILDFINFALQRTGYEITTVGDGAAAMEAVMKDPPDLIVMDCILPKMSGLQLCTELKSNSKSQSIPIILMSASLRIKPEEIVETYGVECFLRKPFHSVELLSAIDSVLKKG
ncbi:MAG TPA: response regulator transcription factor [Elusimicrobiota bacterium]|nr:response regulator transcription factor [Elusimicrobiota bacterium]